MPSSGPHADVSCRVAWEGDARAIAEVQVRAWRASYADLMPAEILDCLDAGDLAAAWEESLRSPGDARRRVLIALDGPAIAGFAITGPSSDPDADEVADGEISELTVDPSHRQRGHGSRLIQACVDTLRADRFRRVTLWVDAAEGEPESALERFVTAAGWAPDGARRELESVVDGRRVSQRRLHVGLRDD